MSKESDLRLVLSAVDTSGLNALKLAFAAGKVTSGRFFDTYGNGCLIYWASERQVVDRGTREHWERSNPLLGCEGGAAIKRVIVGWDANNPSCILKGKDYDVTYPKATYVISPGDVLGAIDSILAERSAANTLEDEAVSAAAKIGEGEPSGVSG